MPLVVPIRAIASITAVERKGNADLFFVITADFETVRAPTQIRLSDSDMTIVATAINGSSMAFEKQAMPPHHLMNAFNVRP